MVQPLISAALSDPKTAIGDDAVIFSELVAYGARIAIGERSQECVSKHQGTIAD